MVIGHAGISRLSASRVSQGLPKTQLEWGTTSTNRSGPPGIAFMKSVPNVVEPWAVMSVWNRPRLKTAGRQSIELAMTIMRPLPGASSYYDHRLAGTSSPRPIDPDTMRSRCCENVSWAKPSWVDSTCVDVAEHQGLRLHHWPSSPANAMFGIRCLQLYSHRCIGARPPMQR